ncbi:MAG: alpha/beta hydrolase [Lachnospiraceae bacterium]|jgi:hypothetical protein
MYIYDAKEKKYSNIEGGYLEGDLPIRSIFVSLGDGPRPQHGMLYEPVALGDKSHIGIILMHPSADYTLNDMGGEMAKRGYRALGSAVTEVNSSLDAKVYDVKRAVDFMYCVAGITKVVLMGHSGGGTLMSAYQRMAEEGLDSVKGNDMLIKCSITQEMRPADGFMALDSNWGIAAMGLFSIDPAIIDENSGQKLDPELDIFNPANGYFLEGANYSQAFLDKFFVAQAERNNAIIQKALDRLTIIEQGKGFYADDEPFIIPAAAQFSRCNKIFPQDITIFARTKRAHDLIHADGSITNEIINCVRLPRLANGKAQVMSSAIISTVKNYLSHNSVRALANYAMKEDEVTGIAWDETYNCTTSNVPHVKCPSLFVGMTGGYEYLASEVLYDRSTSEDKAIAFIEGATHCFDANLEAEKFTGQFGDTKKTLYDYVDIWLSKNGRFDK